MQMDPMAIDLLPETETKRRKPVSNSKIRRMEREHAQRKAKRKAQKLARRKNRK